MKSLELELEERLLIWEDIATGNLDNYYQEYSNKYPGKYLKFICKGSELTEEIAKKLVPNELGFLFDGEVKEYFLFPDYKKINHPFKHKSCKSALGSFISAIEAKGWYCSENPIKKPKEDSKFYFKEMTEFLSAEEKTFHPEKCLIFKIVE